MSKYLPQIKSYLFLFSIGGLIILLDQLTKVWIRTTIPHGSVLPGLEWLSPYARIVHWSNSGVAFGMFQGMGDFFKVLTLIVAAAIIIYFPRIPASEWLMRVALGLQLGGALGNWIDRLTVGAVTDFIAVGDFPVFNVADSSISVGVGLLILAAWMEESRKEKPKTTDQDTNYGYDSTSSAMVSNDTSDPSEDRPEEVSADVDQSEDTNSSNEDNA